MSLPVAPPVKAARLIARAIPVLALGGAYIGQYGFGLYPCEMCWWQRYPHMFALVLAGLAFWRGPVRPLVAVAALAILVSGLIGGYHAGVEYGWWEGITTCTATAAQAEDPLAAIMAAPVVRCDVVQFELFGISLAGWNFLLSTLGALLVLGLIGRANAAS